MWQQAWHQFMTLLKRCGERVYRRSQEYEVGLEELSLSKKDNDIAGSVSECDGIVHHFKRGILFFWVVIWGVRLLHEADMLPRNGYQDHSIVKKEQAEVSTFWLTAMATSGMTIMFYTTLSAHQYHSKRRLSQFLERHWEHSLLVQCWQEYRYFYFTNGSIVFSNHRPFYTLCDATRFPTSYHWQDPVRMNIVFAVVRCIAATLYLRILWPFLINPMQFAFLGYDAAARKLNFPAGSKVLVIGCGSVPHHMRWKKKLGPQGHITALDIEPLVLKDSLRWEKVIEWIRGWFGRRRWISTHVEGCAGEIPLPDASFDFAVAIRCYYVDVVEALRVLKPQGKLLISICGDIEGLPRDARVESTWTGWVVTNAPSQPLPQEQAT